MADENVAEPIVKANLTAEDHVGTFDSVRGKPFAFDTYGRVTYRVDGNGEGVEVRTPVDVADADGVSSEIQVAGFNITPGLHAPCIDIDHVVRVVESSTPGHGHLYIDVAMTWDHYVAILDALAAAGVVEQGYYRASLLRKGTHLRLPWVRKPEADPLRSRRGDS